MTIDEVMAIARLRQWANDKRALQSARTTNYQRRGWQSRNSRSFDARQVRVIDFERVLGSLEDNEQATLVLRYRDKERAESIAKMLACSVRQVAYLEIRARHKLAARLDQLQLL